MKTTTILVSVIVVAIVAMAAVAAEDAATTKPAERSAEQKVLDRFLGNWQGTKTVHKTKWNPKEFRQTDTSSRVRILGGHFIQNKSEASDGTTSLALTTYDVQRKCYRMWYFNSLGVAIEAQGKWDGETKTSTWRSDQGNGLSTVGKGRFLDDNTVKWSWVTKDSEGEISFHIEGKYTRAKQLPKQKDTPKDKPAERSAEQKVLDALVGDWKTTTAAPKAPWNPKAVSGTGTSSCVRVLGGRFIRSNGKVSGGGTVVFLATYDVRRKCYRMWHFDSRGFAGGSTGKWDAKTGTLTMLADQDNGITTTGKIRVVDNDTVEWSSVTKDREGKTVFQMKGKNTRAKQPAKKKDTPSKLIVINVRGEDRKKEDPLYTVSGRRVNLLQLRKIIADGVKNNASLKVLIRGDKHALHGNVAKAIAACRDAGVVQANIGYDYVPIE